MRRNLARLASGRYDLVVLGGGIFGICAAWDAALRGLSVALLERRDFAHGASANCFKMIHGGIRYLQHADVARVRQSARERRVLLRVAPHLARPLPVFVPTYGHGLKGKEVLGAGVAAYDLLTFDRNRGVSDPARRVPASRRVSREEALSLFPGLDGPGFTGGAIFHDGQMYSPARLAFAFLESAVGEGASAANHAEVTGLLQRDGRVEGVRVRDALSDQVFEVRARAVLNATGGWSERLLHASLGRGVEPTPTYSRDSYFVIRRQLSPDLALAISGSTRDPDAIFSRAARHLFLVPWRGRTLVGVWHRVHRGDPDEARVTEEELDRQIAEVNAGYPALDLRREEVALVHHGLVLFGENQPDARDLSYGKRSLLVDHGRTHGVAGLLSLLGVRYTTARSEAVGAIDAVEALLGRAPTPSRTAERPVSGGAIDDFEAFARDARGRSPAGVGEAALRGLLHLHGTGYPRVLALADERADLLRELPGSDTLAAAVVHAAREEMAERLEDAVFRRTDLGTGGAPGPGALETAADLMAAELCWSAERRKAELEATLACFPPASAAGAVRGDA